MPLSARCSFASCALGLASSLSLILLHGEWDGVEGRRPDRDIVELEEQERMHSVPLFVLNFFWVAQPTFLVVR